MKVLLLRGNPRSTGLTADFADLFAEGVLEAGAALTDVRLEQHAIKPCRGCYHCWLATPGRCVHRDDMDQLLPLLQAAAVVVVATPLYFYSMSSSLKCFFERTLPLFRDGQEDTPRGLFRNPRREPELWGRKSLIALIVCAFPDPEAASGTVETFRHIADGMAMGYGGQIVRPESFLIRHRLCRPRTIRRIEAAFRAAGREAGRTGELTAGTMKSAGQPIAADRESYVRYSDIYWEYARSAGGRGLDPENVEARVNSDLRIMMREMVRGFDPLAAVGLEAVIRFEFSEPAQVFEIGIERGECRLAEAPGAAADLVVSCSSETWVRLFDGKLEPRRALRDGVITLAGDRPLFARLARLFRPPSG